MMLERPTLAHVERWIFFVATTLVIGGCVFTVSAFAGQIAIGFIPAMCSGFVVIPCALLLGIKQYVATYRRDAPAAQFVAILYWMLAGLLSFGFVSTLV